MSTNVTAEQILALPKGGGAIQGLGETFHPDLHTGTGSYAIPLEIPNGPNDIAPRLALTYHTGAGNGPFGMGFTLGLLAIARSTEKRIPAYRPDDPLVLAGVGDLVDIGGGQYRLKVDPHSWLVEREGEGFRLIDREGCIYRLGVSAGARLGAPAAPNQVLSWHLEQIEDALGNTVDFTYLRDGGQLYLARIDYSIYSVRFNYEAGRPDPVLEARAGFLLSTRLRCASVELQVTTEASSLVRRWDLAYAQAAPGGHSLLATVRLTGFGADGTQAMAPMLKLGYTEFCPRKLERMRGETPAAEPGALGAVGRELVDWYGSGLPDLIEITGVRGRVWPNRGDGTWGWPRSLPTLPEPVRLESPQIAFVDMEGNGTADLVLMDRSLAGYYPHRPGGGFERAVHWPQAPGVSLADPNVRLIDLDADGIADLLFTGPGHFVLYYRDPAGGWRAPVTVARSRVPPISFSDHRVYLADMNGDGLADIVRVDGAAISYWPYLGHGRWDEPIVLQHTPTLPPHFDPQRLFFTDIDGDGCADLAYVDLDRVMVWINGGGTRLSDPVEIQHVPPAFPGQVRLADMRGSGTAGLLWSYQARQFYLDFTGSAKPYLLSRIDNGLGLVTEIEYSTSTVEAARDRRGGRPWSTFLPFPVAVITRVASSDGITGCRTQSTYRYHNGCYDGVRREFAGFAEVEATEEGDATMPGLLARTHFHVGLDPAALGRPLATNERERLRALRGRVLRTAFYGLDGSPDEARPYLVTESDWACTVEVAANGAELLFPHMVERRSVHFERRAAPYQITVLRDLAHDAYGNVTEREEVATMAGHPEWARHLHTSTIYAKHAAHRFRNKAARIIQRDETGRVIATNITYFDHQPEGMLDDQGLVTRQEVLVLTDALVAAAYGPVPPDFAGLGYHRRPGEDGWWIDQGRYERIDDALGLRGTVTNARGAVTRLVFDPHKIHIAQIIDALGNQTTAAMDYRANRLSAVTDANGVTIENRYDPLGRLARAIEPGASEALPTLRYRYSIEQLPAALTTEQRVRDGAPDLIIHRSVMDGFGRVIEERTVTSQGEIAETSHLYCARGLVKCEFLPYQGGPGYSPPPDTLPRRTYRYDALGRLLETVNPDGSLRRQVYEPGEVWVYDEEDTRAGPEALHSNTPSRQSYDASGRLALVTSFEAGHEIMTGYDYDAKGRLTTVTDALGRRTSLIYDLAGRRLRVDAPESGTTLFAMDAAGNHVERRAAGDQITRFEYDELDRPLRTVFPASGVVAAEYIYDDTNRPAPGGGGLNTRGRLAQAGSPAGREAFDYDGMGRVIAKRMRPEAMGGEELAVRFFYRADGRLRGVAYPAPPGGGSLHVPYEYDDRGLLRRIPGFVKHIQYNTAGQRTRVEHANGTVTTYNYDPLTLRVTSLTTTGPQATVLQHYGYQYDWAGNLLAVDSLDPLAAANYTYDDLYRLTAASNAAGDSWSYAYDGLGNLLAKTGVGAYSYDLAGRLAAAGPLAYSYTMAGQVAMAGTALCTYDPLGRLTQIMRDGEQMTCTADHSGRRVRIQVTGAEPLDIIAPDDLVSIENGGWYGYVFDGKSRVARVQLDGSGTLWLHGDHQGSITLVTGLDGQLVQRFHYDPYGAQLGPPPAPGGEVERFRYTGQAWDDWAGLYLLGARYYDPWVGRFLAPDSVVPELYTPQAWNRYSYAGGNPLRYVDPTGHFWAEIGNWFKNNWKTIVAVLAMAAVAVLTVLSAGTLAPLLGVAVGWIYAGVIAGAVVGGVVGGVSASRAGGDVLLGVLTGMAVGGGAALGGFAVAKAMVITYGAKSLGALVLGGGLSGATNGAGIGFCSAFAGGQGTLGDIAKKMLIGALSGAVTGAALGGGLHALNQGWLKTPDFLLIGDTTKRTFLTGAAASLGELAREPLSGESLSWSNIWHAGLECAAGSAVALKGMELGGSYAKIDQPGVKMDFWSTEHQSYTVAALGGVSNPIFMLDYTEAVLSALRKGEEQ